MLTAKALAMGSTLASRLAARGAETSASALAAMRVKATTRIEVMNMVVVPWVELGVEFD